MHYEEPRFREHVSRTLGNSSLVGLPRNSRLATVKAISAELLLGGEFNEYTRLHG